MPVIPVDSADDPRLADYRGLTDVALRRRLEPEQGLYMAEGAKVISRALAAGHQPRSVLVSERWLAGVVEALEGAGVDAPVYVAQAPLLESVTGYQVHRGALAAMEGSPEAASVFVAHTGLEDITGLRDLWRSIPDHKVLHMVYAVVPPDRVPADHDGRVELLWTAWERIDAWIASRPPEATTTS